MEPKQVEHSAETHCSHTPGPWKVRMRVDIVQDCGIYGGYFVGSTRGNGDDLTANIKEQDEANARLIAAAPEMLDALKAIIALRWGYDGDCGAVAIAEHAIRNCV